MKTYCLKCKKDTKSLDSKIFRTINNCNKKCNDCKNKKSRFIKEQEAEDLLILSAYKNE